MGLQFLLLSLLLSVLFVRALEKPAVAMGLVDCANERKSHLGQVPLTGGIGIFLAVAISLVPAQAAIPHLFSVAFIAAMIAGFVGMIDDLFDISHRVRLMTQAVAALIVVYWGGAQLLSVGDLFGFGALGLGYASLIFSMVAVIGVCNAFNMIDGLDGLSGGMGLVTLLSLLLLDSVLGQAAYSVMLVILIGAMLGFLFWNARSPWRNRAFAFMGDTGTMFLGMLIAWFLIVMSQPTAIGTAVIRPVTALWLLALPLMDTIGVIIRRLRKGKSPFVADRDHIHHILQMAGFTVGETVVIMWLLALFCAGIGVAGELLQLPEYLMFYAFILLFAGYGLFIRHAWKVMRFLHRMTGRTHMAK